MRPRGLAPLALLLLLPLLAPAAAAESLQSIEATAGQAPSVKPGESGTVTLTVRFCYRATPVQPTTVNVVATSGAAWASVRPSPESFRAEVAAGQRCNAREVALQVTMGRDAPAFQPATVTTTLSSQGVDPVEVPFVLQAGYTAEVRAKTPQVVRVERSDAARFTIEVTVAANEATRIEVVGADPRGMLTMTGHAGAVAGAGRGLDAPVTQPLQLTLAASPGATLGKQDFRINVTSAYERSPSITGGATTIVLPVEVVAGSAANPVPAAGPLLLAVGALAGALLLRRRRP
jgi:uncharacterized membrane protein